MSGHIKSPRYLRLGLALMVGFWVGCIDAGSVDNPPPVRPATLTIAAPPKKPTAPHAELAPEPHAHVDPDPVETMEDPSDPEPTPEPPRPALNPGERKHRVVVDLLDTLQIEAIESPHAKKRPIMPPGKRSYLDPWRNNPFIYKTIWSDGGRAQFALRSALTLPAPGTATWSVDVPAGAVLRFGLAAGARVPKGKSVAISVSVTTDPGKPEATRAEIFKRDEPSKSLHKLKWWTEHRIDLSAFAGQTVELKLSAHHPAPGFRYTAFFAEPVITAPAEATPAGPGRVEPPNVLFIVVDAMRGDLVGPKRKKRSLPRLFDASESLIDDGAVATRAFSVGNQTRLSTYAFLSAQYPAYGLYANRRWAYSDSQRTAFYAAEPPLLPILLREQGYRTMGVANNLFVFGNLELCFDMGFDRFIDHRHGTKDTAWITETASQWISENADQRWFLMVNYNGPHQPYQPPSGVMASIKPKLDGVKGLSKPYLGEVKWTDDNILILLKKLDEAGLTDNTLVVVSADHGEVMDPEHECYNRNWDSKCYLTHGKTLYDEEIHVPWIMRWPKAIPAGTVVDTPVSHVDLGPTIVGLTGGTPHPQQLGRNLAATFRGEITTPDVPVISEARLATAIRWEGFKYIIHDRKEMMVFKRKTLFDSRKTLEELYDLTVDPGELDNLALKGPHPQLPKMRAILKAHHIELARRRAGGLASGAPEPAPPGPAAPAPSAPNEIETGAAEPPETLTTTALNPSAAVAEAWTTLVYPRSGRVTGRIEVDGRAHVESLDSAAPPVVDASGLTVDFLGGSRCGFRLRTEPPDARLTFRLKVDDVAVTPQQLFVGRYGLRLLTESALHPADMELAHATRPPPIAPDVTRGIFIWRTGERDRSADLERADELDSEVRGMMKAWGYAGK